MKVRVPEIPRKTTSINSIRSAGGSRPTLDVFTELMAEANTDCAINRFPSRFVSSFVTLISFDWLTTFIHHFFYLYRCLPGSTPKVTIPICHLATRIYSSRISSAKVMRLVDSRIASLRTANDYIEGLKPDKTEVQVLSPMLGHVLADKVDVA